MALDELLTAEREGEKADEVQGGSLHMLFSRVIYSKGTSLLYIKLLDRCRSNLGELNGPILSS